MISFAQTTQFWFYITKLIATYRFMATSARVPIEAQANHTTRNPFIWQKKYPKIQSPTMSTPIEKGEQRFNMMISDMAKEITK